MSRDPPAWSVNVRTEKRLAEEHEALGYMHRQRYTEKPEAPAIAAARRELRSFIKPGATIYTTCTHVSSSGMMRHLQLFVVQGGRIRNITAEAARAQGDKVTDSKSGWVIKAGGCGMDMGFHEVYNLASALFRGRRFKCLQLKGKRCPHNSHANREATEMHEGGGYSLNQEWL